MPNLINAIGNTYSHIITTVKINHHITCGLFTEFCIVINCHRDLEPSIIHMSTMNSNYKSVQICKLVNHN